MRAEKIKWTDAEKAEGGRLASGGLSPAEVYLMLALDRLDAMTAGWKPIETAPKDGTWILLRSRNMAAQPMIPVVTAFKPIGAAHHGDSWVDSRGFENCDSLAAAEGADWHPLPLI